jgi:hypothetical protein
MSGVPQPDVFAHMDMAARPEVSTKSIKAHVPVCSYKPWERRLVPRRETTTGARQWGS